MVVGVEAILLSTMELVSNLTDVIPDDMVVASGVDGIFPKGFVIGTVASRSAVPACTGHQVRPAVDFSSLEDVLVVTVPPRRRFVAEPAAAKQERQVRTLGVLAPWPRRWPCRRRWPA